MASPSTQVMDPNGPTGKLCSWIEALTLEDIPEDVKTRAKYLILDGIACALIGAHLPWSEKAVNAVLQMEAAADCGVIGWEKKIGPLAAALINSTFIQGFELDDVHSEAPLHSNSIILPALFAAVDHAKKDNLSFSGSLFLLSYIIGLEVGPRAGNGLYGSHMLTMGWHSGAVFGPTASSTAVSKLLSLRANQIEDAIGIACTQAGGLMAAQYESEVKRMQHGFAARNGLFAALMAKEGYIGIKKVFERPYGGFLSTFGRGSGHDPRYLPDEICKELGTKWETYSVRVKPYAAMAGTHATIDCIRKLQNEHPEKMSRYSEIASIRYEMGTAAFHHGGWEAQRPLTSTGAQMSNTYIAAMQIVDGRVLLTHFSHEILDRDAVWDLVGKSICVESDTHKKTWRQEATVTFKDGTVLTATVEAPVGVDPPLSNEQVVEKWRTTVDGIIDDERRQKIEEAVLRLDTLEDIEELSKLLLGVSKGVLSV
ncbi:putative immune-responsive protein [Xylogone sp. PMI_703]|nr:putative immune-responsive protein [Xylogone sp. PMI_703]